MKEIKNIFSDQRKFFDSGKSNDIDVRIKQLKTLKKVIRKMKRKYYKH